MILKQISISQRYVPIPISFLITTANSFDCDIYIKNSSGNVNVKNYDEMIGRLRPKGSFLLFYFNGKDEQAAQKKIERIFQD